MIYVIAWTYSISALQWMRDVSVIPSGSQHICQTDKGVCVPYITSRLCHLRVHIII